MASIDVTDMVLQAWREMVLPIIEEIENGKLACNNPVYQSIDDRCVLHLVPSDSIPGEKV